MGGVTRLEGVTGPVAIGSLTPPNGAAPGGSGRRMALRPPPRGGGGRRLSSSSGFSYSCKQKDRI